VVCNRLPRQAVSGEAILRQEMAPEIRVHDVVVLKRDVGRWSEGDLATVVGDLGKGMVLLEFADDRGHTVDLLAAPAEVLEELDRVAPEQLSISTTR
jgi:hypothetical protein